MNKQIDICTYVFVDLIWFIYRIPADSCLWGLQQKEPTTLQNRQLLPSFIVAQESDATFTKSPEKTFKVGDVVSGEVSYIDAWQLAIAFVGFFFEGLLYLSKGNSWEDDGRCFTQGGVVLLEKKWKRFLPPFPAEVKDGAAVAASEDLKTDKAPFLGLRAWWLPHSNVWAGKQNSLQSISSGQIKQEATIRW